MKFEIGSFYRTKEGKKAQILMLNDGQGMMIGAVLSGQVWISQKWTSAGIYSNYNGPHENNIVGEWRDPIKYFVELWGNEFKPSSCATGLTRQLLGPSHLMGVEKSEYCPIKYRITVEEVPE